MGTISKDFSYREFEESMTASEKHICNVITSFKVRDSIKALTLAVLQPLRDAWLKQIRINSGYRCEALNQLVGGVSTSQHVKGEAADINTANPDESYMLSKLAKDLNLPFDQMILYPRFVHISHKLSGLQRRQILYNYRYKGPRL